MKRIFICFTVLVVLVTTGCSQRAWYEGAKQSQRQECYKAPPFAREECLKALDSVSYDEYQRSKQDELKK